MTVENKQMFFARIEPFLSIKELTLIKTAYIFAKFGHRAQSRKEGIRYFEHSRRVAIILMDELHCYAPNIICIALLHDCLEDTEDIDTNVIQYVFGFDIARDVRSLSKDDSGHQAYYDRLEFISMQALTVKYCDRIDNLRSLIATNNHAFIKRKLEETRDYLFNVRDPKGDFEAEALDLLKQTWGKVFDEFESIPMSKE